MATIFRKYGQEDFDELVSMVLGLYTKDGTKPSHMNSERIELTISELERENSNGQILIIEKDGVVIGYSIVNFFWSNEFSGKILYLDELFIKPEARNAGVGHCFFEHIRQNPATKSVAIMLETTRDNEKAVQFYQRIGFTEHHNYLMFKNLDEFSAPR